jgi:hypothetical protein
MGTCRPPNGNDNKLEGGQTSTRVGAARTPVTRIKAHLAPEMDDAAALIASSEMHQATGTAIAKATTTGTTGVWLLVAMMATSTTT